ncbi:MAG: acyl-CoA thioesterase [Peptoniphilaceae bacterium]
MKEFTNSSLVKSEDLNHHETLFAGKALSDLCHNGFLCAAKSHGNPKEIVFYKIEGVRFIRAVEKGDIVTYKSKIVYLGKTSISCYVSMESLSKGETCLEGFLTYVCIDEFSRNKKEHGLVLDEIEDDFEKELRIRALNYKNK